MKIKQVTLATVTSLLFAGAAFADDHTVSSPAWNYVQGGYSQLDVDDMDSEPSGFNLEGSVQMGTNVFVRGEYLSASDDVSMFGSSLDLDTSFTTIALGYFTDLSPMTDVYAAVSYERVGFEVSGFGESESDSESGYGGYVGVRSHVTENVELFGEVGYIKISDYDISDASLKAGATVYVSEQLGLGASYKMFDDFSILSVTARYAF